MLTIIAEVGVVIDIKTVQRHAEPHGFAAGEQHEATLVSLRRNAPDLGPLTP